MFPELLARLRHAFTGDADAQDTIAAVARATHISGMDRRAFLKTALIGAAVAATVDVEQLLWSPGTKTIFLPEAPTIVEADALFNGLVTPEWITREALRILKKNLTLAGAVNRRYDDTFFLRDGTRCGETVRVRTAGAVAAMVPLDQQFTAFVNGPTREQLQDDPRGFIERDVKPRMKQLASIINNAGVNVVADLPMPHCGVESAVRLADAEAGVSLRAVSQYDIQRDRMRLRFDVLGGKLPEPV